MIYKVVQVSGIYIHTHTHTHIYIYVCMYTAQWFSDIYAYIPGNSADKESTCNAGDPGSIPESGRYPVEGIGYLFQYSWASLVAQTVKNLPAMRETWVGSLGWEDLWVRDQLPTPVLLPGESHGRRSLVGYGPRDPKESDTTEWLFIFTYVCINMCIFFVRFSSLIGYYKTLSI